MPRAEQGGRFGVPQLGQNQHFKKYCQLEARATVPKNSRFKQPQENMADFNDIMLLLLKGR